MLSKPALAAPCAWLTSPLFASSTCTSASPDIVRSFSRRYSCAVGLLENCYTAARFAIELARKDRLWVAARIEGRSLIHRLINPEFLRPKGPPERDKNRNRNGDEESFMP